MSLANKIESAIWWALRPRLYGEAYRTLSRKLRPRRYEIATLDEVAAADTWCREHVVSHDVAIQKVGGDGGIVDFEEVYATELQAAKARELECEFRMGGGGHPGLLFNLAEAIQASRVIETGVAYGWSSLAILLSLSKRPEARIVSTDRPYPRCDERWVGCVVPDAVRSQWTLIRQADREALPQALKILPQIDLCHYDSDKSRQGRRWGYPLLWDAVRPGGVFMSDDIGGDLEFSNFCGQRPNVEPIVVEIQQAGRDKDRKYAGILVKPEECE